MTAVLRCDGCDKLADGVKPVGWLQVRRLKEEVEKESVFDFGDTSRFEFVGHCCSVECLANLALAQNDGLDRATTKRENE